MPNEPVDSDEFDSLEWWYDLDVPLLARSEFLQPEDEFASRLAADGVTYDVSVLLPRLPNDVRGLGAYLKAPARFAGDPSDRREDWGTDYRPSLFDSFTGVAISRLGFVGRLPDVTAAAWHLHDEWGLDMFGTDVRVQMDTWWDNVRTWLEIATGQRLTRVGAEQRSYDMHDRMRIWVASSAGEKRERWMGGGIGLSEVPPVHGVDGDIFAACLGLSDVEPHFAWSLLRDARALQGVRQFRRAVIDAAIAAELAVGAILDERLENVEEAVRSALLGKNPMLGSKTGILERLGEPLAKSFTNRLISIRNKAVHKGFEPSPDECRGAIEEALLLVQKVFPLPTPQGADHPLVCRW